MNIQQLDNIFIATDGEDWNVKICDYGFYRNNPELSQELSRVGTYFQYDYS